MTTMNFTGDIQYYVDITYKSTINANADIKKQYFFSNVEGVRKCLKQHSKTDRYIPEFDGTYYLNTMTVTPTINFRSVNERFTPNQILDMDKCIESLSSYKFKGVPNPQH